MRNARRLSLACLWLALAACSSPGSVTGCSISADCPEGSICESEVCRPGIALTITAPVGPITTAGTVQLEITAVGGPPAEVAVEVDGVVVARVGPPYAAALDTTGLAEWQHEVRAAATAGGRTFRSAPLVVVVDRTPPAAPVFTSSALASTAPVAVAGTAEPRAVVTLRSGGLPVGPDLTVSDAGSWATAVELGEGQHPFTARATDAAGNASGEATWSVTVDRTAPAVVSVSPAANATGVSSRAPVVVTFSEALAPATVSPTAVRLSGESGDLAWSGLALSVDGRTLTATPGSVPSRATTELTATLWGLTDPAGNALPLTTWHWPVPDWIANPEPFYMEGDYPRWEYAITPTGAGVLAWQDTYMACWNEVLREVDSAWQSIGAPAPRDETTMMANCGGVSVAVDGAGRILLAYHEFPYLEAGAQNVYVARFDGDSWAALGDALNGNPSPVGFTTKPVIRVDESDRPVVLWHEVAGDQDHLVTKRWNGTTWDLLGDVQPSTPTQLLGPYALALSGPRVTEAFVVDGFVKVARFAGTYPVPWEPTPIDAGATDVAIAVDASGVETVAYVSDGVVHAAQPITDGDAQPGWRTLTDPPGTGMGAGRLALAYRAGGPQGEELALAFVDTEPRVFLLDGSSWDSISDAIGTRLGACNGQGSGLATNGSGMLSFAWSERRGGLTTSPTAVPKLYNH